MKSDSTTWSRHALRAAFYAAGAVASAAGFDTVIRGAKSIPGQRRLATPAIESEVRFYGAFYVAYGLVVLRTAPRADHDAGAVRALAVALFSAGLARAVGWHASGRPHPGQLALLAVELCVPPLAVAWQARVAAD